MNINKHDVDYLRDFWDSLTGTFCLSRFCEDCENFEICQDFDTTLKIWEDRIKEEK